MKKWFALLLALCLLLGCAALGEEAQVVRWSDVEAVLGDLGLTGSFVTFDAVDVKLWVPDGLTAMELTQEILDAGYIGYFLGEDAHLAVVYIDAEGISVEEYAEMLAESGSCEQIAMLNVNGLLAVRYQMPENDSLNIAFATEAGYLLEVTMSPLSAEGANVVWAIVGASIQAAE